MLAHRFMTRCPVSVRPDTTIWDARLLISGLGFNAIPVVNAQQDLVGIVSATDLVEGGVGTHTGAYLRPPPLDPSVPAHTVSQVMTTEVVALPEMADQSEYCSAMLGHGFRSIPVVSDRRLVGIVSASDLLRTQLRSDEEIAVDVRDRIRQYTGGRDLWSITVADGVVTLDGPARELALRIAVLLAETVPGALHVHTPQGGVQGRRPVGSSAAAAQSRGPWDHRGLRVMGVEECLALLRDAPMGRLAFLHEGGPVVLPINHAMVGTELVFRTAWGAKVLSVDEGGPVAFEVDGIDEQRQAGWSVVATGTPTLVNGDLEIGRLDQLGLNSWAGLDEDALWIKIRTTEISGREIARA